MSDEVRDNGIAPAASDERKRHILNRRNLLLGTTTLVAAAALTSDVLAQAQKAAPTASPSC
jgi:nitrous oxide reductase